MASVVNALVVAVRKSDQAMRHRLCRGCLSTVTARLDPKKSCQSLGSLDVLWVMQLRQCYMVVGLVHTVSVVFVRWQFVREGGVLTSRCGLWRATAKACCTVSNTHRGRTIVRILLVAQNSDRCTAAGGE